MKTATGYSFPSGHSMNASTVFGGGVVRRDLPFVLRITLFLIMSLVGFSRLYLGVHTPQDVLVAFIAGMFVMSLTILLLR
ncbi:MAG: phosphatase PAP2 family protein [Erysipelotrichaceae bacterium]|nr:phosphatase PAP2 family protein [Erysipelotrichaceae bacterium]